MADSRYPHLYHFSEDPAIARFEPRITPSSSIQDEAFVWAVDAEHAHLYYFPRDCPRVTFCAAPTTTYQDIDRFFAHTTASYVTAIESAWLPAMRETHLYRYVFSAGGFECLDAGAGYWVNRGAVLPERVEPVGDLLEALADAGVELRILPSLWPLHDAVIESTLQFSIIRWRNAKPHPG